ncbi:MAG: hypothetical protein WDW36_007374 [Sanguina aurantia]
MFSPSQSKCHGSQVATNAGSAATQMQQHERLEKLYGMLDAYQRKMEVERRQLQSVDKELEVLQARALEVRRVAKGPQSAEAAQKQASRQMQVLENRLQIAEQRFSETLSRNKELREDIDALSKQRQAADAVQQKLSREMVTLTSEIYSLGEVTRAANTARSAAQHACLAVLSQGEVEQDVFETERRELARAIEADQRLLQTQAKRLQRVLGQGEAAESRRPMFLGTDSAAGGGDARRRGTGDGGAGGAAGQGAGAEGDEGVDPDLARVTSAAAAASRLVSELAGIAGMAVQDLAAVVAHFEGLEAANFLLFNGCNDMNVGVGALQRKVRATENDIRALEADGLLSRQKEIIHSTMRKRDAAAKRAEGFREKQVVLERRVALLKAGAVTVLRALGCTPIVASTPAAAATQAPAQTPSDPTLTQVAHILDTGYGAATAHAGGSGRPPLPPQTQPGHNPNPSSRPESGSTSERGARSERGSRPDPGSDRPASHYSTLLQHLGQLEARSRAVVAVYSTLMGKPSAVIAGFTAATSRPSSAQPPNTTSTTTSANSANSASQTTSGTTFLTEIGAGPRGLSDASLGSKVPAVAAAPGGAQARAGLHAPAPAPVLAPALASGPQDPGPSQPAAASVEGQVRAQQAQERLELHMPGAQAGGRASAGSEGGTGAAAECVGGGQEGGLEADDVGQRASFAFTAHSASGPSSAGGEESEEDGDAVPLTRQQILSAQGRSRAWLH